jgi:hypothetical protein
LLFSKHKISAYFIWGGASKEMQEIKTHKKLMSLHFYGTPQEIWHLGSIWSAKW